MRAVHLCSSGRVGGVETSVLAMLASLRAAEPDWQLVTVAPEDGALLDGARRLGCQGLALPFPPTLAAFGEVSAVADRLVSLRAGACAIAYARSLGRVIRAQQADVVHAHGIKMQVLSRWSVPRRVPLVWHAHDYVSGRPASRGALRVSAGRCRTLIANSRNVAADFRDQLHTSVPTTVLYNGVDLARFAPDGPRLDLDASAATHPEPGTVRIGLPATFGRWKGQDVFLRALALLSRERPWRGYVIGGAVYQTDGSQWSLGQLQALATELGIADRVVFTGLVHEMPSALRALDIVAHASTQPEPFGMAIAEAMACGRATIVARAGGAAEIVHDGVDAIGYRPGDHEGLSQALAALIADPDRRARLSAEARRTAERDFDARRLGPALADIDRALATPIP